MERFVWKGYFFIIVALIAYDNWSRYNALIDLKILIPTVFYFFFIIDIVAIVGLFSYIWKKTLFRTVFWKSVFVLLLFSCLFELIISVKKLISISDFQVQMFGVFLCIISTLLVIPTIWALYQYSFRCHMLWNIKKKRIT